MVTLIIPVSKVAILEGRTNPHTREGKNEALDHSTLANPLGFGNVPLIREDIDLLSSRRNMKDRKRGTNFHLILIIYDRRILTK